jgi:hypothetical protein
MAYWGCVLLLLFMLTPGSVGMAGVGGLGVWGEAVLVLVPVIVLVLAASYVVLRLLRRWQRPRVVGRPMAYWRCILLVFLVQLAALVPLKVLLYWAFGLKYFISVPEFSTSV